MPIGIRTVFVGIYFRFTDIWLLCSIKHSMYSWIKDLLSFLSLFVDSLSKSTTFTSETSVNIQDVNMDTNEDDFVFFILRRIKRYLPLLLPLTVA